MQFTDRNSLSILAISALLSGLVPPVQAEPGVMDRLSNSTVLTHPARLPAIDLEQTLRELVAIPSISKSPEQCKRAVDYVDSLFTQSPFHISRFEHNGVYSIVIAKRADLNFDLVFLGHLDVVPASHDSAYTARAQGDKLFGRGTVDMKGSVAAMLKLFISHATDPRFDDWALILTTDEEVGGFNGVKYLIDSGLTAKTVFNPDGAYSMAPSISEKGILHFTLTAKGIGAHGSRPWEGKNAIDLLIQDIDRVRQSYVFADSANIWTISFNLGKIEGGEATNSVPANAKASIDIRFPPKYRSSEIKTKIQAALKNSDLEIKIEADPVQIDERSPVLRNLTDALESNGIVPKLMHEHGASDARWFVPQGSQILLIKAAGSGSHIEQEWVSISGLQTFFQVLESFIGNYGF